MEKPHHPCPRDRVGRQVGTETVTNEGTPLTALKRPSKSGMCAVRVWMAWCSAQPETVRVMARGKQETSASSTLPRLPLLGLKRSTCPSASHTHSRCFRLCSATVKDITGCRSSETLVSSAHWQMIWDAASGKSHAFCTKHPT